MRYAIFLRAINVGGRRIKMAELREAFEEARFDDVATHKEETTVRVLDQATTGRGLRTIQGIYDRFLQE